MNHVVRVSLWGTIIGYLGYPPGDDRIARFEFDSEFMKSGIQISPVYVKYPPERFSFSDLNYKSFQGLPGFIADSLPDSYGNRLIDLYMAEKKIPPEDVTPLDRLNYVADRGMGALEYQPGEKLQLQRTGLDLRQLSELADMVLQRKENLSKLLHSAEDRAAAVSMIRIGSSAGGARSKALVAISSKGTLLDGTVNHGTNYTYWVLKFDSGSNKDKDARDPKGMPVLEYIYSLIAQKAGINIPNTQLIDDGKERHFLIERFDRIVRNKKLDKLHYVSWSGLGHADRDEINSYEQLILLCRKMGFAHDTENEIFRRAVFNIIGRNQDDHTKNTGFLMDRSGKWQLSPAFDLTYSYDPLGRFTRHHQCWLNQKNDDFELQDLLAFGRYCNLSENKALKIIRQIGDSFGNFVELAREYQLNPDIKRTVEANLRLYLLR